MAEAPALSSAAAARSAERVFRGLVQCLDCATRRLVDIRPGEFFILRRDGTVQFTCQHCGLETAHRLVRMGA